MHRGPVGDALAVEARMLCRCRLCGSTKAIASAHGILAARCAPPPSWASAAIRPSRRCSPRRGSASQPSIHEQNAVMGRANRVLVALCRRHRLVFPGDRQPAGRRAQDKLRYTGNPVRAIVLDKQRRRPIKPPTADAAVPPLDLRRQPGRALLRRVHAGGHARRCRKAVRRNLEIVQQCRPEDIERGASAYAALDVALRAPALLHRHAEAHRRRASRHLPVRRLDDRRARRHRPARDPGAAAACDRQRPAAQCRKLRRGGRRLGHAAGRARCRKNSLHS